MSPAPRPTPADHEARRAIVEELDRSLFVEAAAGTGKTTAMVKRIVGLLASGRAGAPELAVITFTEAAAAELRDRVRVALEEAAACETRPAPARERCARALASLDDAAITTIHAFAQRLLVEHPFEAGLPPVVEVLDEILAGAGFDERWEAFVEHLLADPATEATLLRGFALGLELRDLRSVAEAFHAHHDRLATWRPDPPPPPPLDVGPVATALERAAEALAWCSDGDDLLARHLRRLVPFAARLRAASGELDALALLAEAPRFTLEGKGRKASWGGDDGIREVRSRLATAQETRDALLEGVRVSVLLDLLHHLRTFALDAAEARRRAGRLEFGDLLVLARDLLRDDAGVRAAVRSRYRHVLVDEFQDTDPLQVEIVGLITGAYPGDANPSSGASLFVVGDPKQSIYRFRRADIGVYDTVRASFGAGVLSLTENFRSDASILAWANHVFDGLMVPAPGVQAAHVPMTAHREGAADPRVGCVGGPVDAGASQVRALEADAVAALARRARREGWTVVTESGERRATYADMAVLLPTRRNLPALERALGAAGVPYRIEARSLLFATQEVRDLLNVLRAIDDPADPVALVAALRSPAFACGDDALAEFHRAGGCWNVLAPAPTLPEEHPVLGAMAWLRELHEAVPWTPLSEMVDRVLRERRFFELAFAHPRPRDHWRRLRFVADQARHYTEVGGATATLRSFVDWAERQADAAAQVNEVVVPEPDDDAVRILTMHGAKGLEFPIVFLTGLGTRDVFRAPKVLCGDTGAVEVSTGARSRRALFRTHGYDALEQREREAMEAEGIRLLYVAATRARDHLIVSLFRSASEAGCQAARLAARCEEAPTLWRELPLVPDGPPPGHREPARPSRHHAPVSRAEWLAEREALLLARGRAPAVAATTLAADTARSGSGGADDSQVGTATEPWRRGRAGTAIGRAVHATLQSVDLATGAGLEAVARAQAAAEGVPERTDEVRALARAALGAPIVRAAAATGTFWREVAVGAEIEGVLVEGYVDLLVETPEGLVVVDYKTDRRPPAGGLGHYRTQGAVYAALIEATLARPVARCVFVFVGGGTAVELELEDLPGAVGEVRALLRARAPAGTTAR